ncbi:MAG: CpaD family pilus assembly protein [Hyphomonadaceae bacterium]
MTKSKLTISAMLMVSAGLAACTSVAPAVPVEYVDTPLLERFDLDVVERTETLELVLDPANNRLTDVQRNQVTNFVRVFNDVGQGQLSMILPEGTSNPQSAIGAIAEAREIAWENGVNYNEIKGHASPFEFQPVVTLSFTRFEAVKPQCESFGTIDISNTKSNGDLSNLGCSVRTNIAAMIADPADLLGNRQLDPGDSERRYITFEAYRQGEATASERNEGESGAISDAVDN